MLSGRHRSITAKSVKVLAVARRLRSWTHYLGGKIKGLERVEDVELDNLLNRLLKGEDVVNKIVMSQLRLVFQETAGFDHSNKDELFSVAIDGIYLSIEKYLESRQRKKESREEFTNPIINQAKAFRSFMLTWVKSHIMDFICDSRPVPVPRQSLQKNKELLPTVVEYIDQKARKCEGQTALDVAEIIEKACTHPADKSIVRLRLEGYDNAEIAKKIGYSAAFVSVRKSNLEVAFRRLLNLGGK